MTDANHLKETISENRAEIFAVFHELHAMPELGMEEVRTSAYLADSLERSGFTVERGVSGSTGIVGTLRGEEKGPVVALRADMDALPFTIDGEQRNIHACGHDANCTMVLMAALTLVRIGIKKGTLKIVFQPAEETLKGARVMIASGLLRDIDALFGIHLRPIQEARLGQATPALYHGSSYLMTAKITGVAAHGARPHLGVNSIDAAAAVVNGINAIRLDPSVPYSVKTTRLWAGGPAHNVIPETAEMTFDLRAQTNDAMEQLLEKTENVVRSCAESFGAKGEILSREGVPAAEYDQELIQEAKQAIEDTLGTALDPMSTPGGEDFHFYSTEGKIRTAYIGLGADLRPGLHHPEMSFDEEALVHGTRILTAIVKNRLF
jgi:amidohydrolase